MHPAVKGAGIISTTVMFVILLSIMVGTEVLGIPGDAVSPNVQIVFRCVAVFCFAVALACWFMADAARAEED